MSKFVSVTILLSSREKCFLRHRGFTSNWTREVVPVDDIASFSFVIKRIASNAFSFIFYMPPNLNSSRPNLFVFLLF